jgi:hypothetical protein
MFRDRQHLAFSFPFRFSHLHHGGVSSPSCDHTFPLGARSIFGTSNSKSKRIQPSLIEEMKPRGIYGRRKHIRTFPASSAPYGAVSKAPRRAPSLSPPRSSCLICVTVDCTWEVETGTTDGVSEDKSKLAGESGSSASMLMVRQLMLAMTTSHGGVVSQKTGSRTR